jgi:enoyl-CoA hydratase/carnithine racemase
MTDLTTLVVRRLPPVCEVVLNRPQKLNAINEDMARELSAVLLDCEQDEEIQVVVLTGSQKAFSAGFDMAAFANDGLPFTNYRARYNARAHRTVLQLLANYTKPLISAVEGYCLGGGLELALFSDLIIASETAQFGFPEVSHGMIPGAGATQTLPRLIGTARALELMWTGRRFGATLAKEYGLINHIVTAATALNEARRLAGEIASNAPLALMMIKQAVRRGVDTPLMHGVALESDLNYLLNFSEDMKEGIAAFAEKRKPKFVGR